MQLLSVGSVFGMLALLSAQAADDRAVVSGLAGQFRNGQVFLTWSEGEAPAGTTLNVYSSTAELTSAESLRTARVLARHIHPHSARDWWQDPASFSKDAAPAAPAGFVIRDGSDPLDPAGGLFVHTVTRETAGPRFYAVTVTHPTGEEDLAVVRGRNSLSAAITGRVEQPLPIWLDEGSLPARGSAKGHKLCLTLHGRGGGVTAGPRKGRVNCLWFGDARQGWREGLAFKFHLHVSEGLVRMTPMDRVWVGRAVTESRDGRDHCPAINTWWYGYHSEIYRTTSTPEAVAPNYTERYLVALVRWAQAHLGADANQTYVTGGSMGGSGTVAMALHFPHVFAAAYAQVPVYSCTRPGKGSATRLECMVGSLQDRKVVTSEGIPLLDYMDGASSLRKAKGPVPPIFACNGRRDGSIPWENNPPFYRAANDARQAFAVFWNNGTHGMAREAPPDVRAWADRIFSYRLDESYLAFTNCSDNRDYGNGDPEDGDLVGWINRGLAWREMVDAPDRFAVTVVARYPGIRYPVVVDVTPRRVQRFRMDPGQRVSVRVGDAAPTGLAVDAQGLLTVRNVAIRGAEGTRIHVTKTLLARAAATDFGARYEARYLHLRPDDETAAMERENRACREELAKLTPDNAAHRIALGTLYVEAGEADKANAELKAALDLPKLSPFEQGDALTGLASAALLKGNREAAVRFCKDLAGRGLNTTARYRINPVNEAKYAIQFLGEPDLDYLRLPFDTGAKAFPKPQQATYTEEFVPLTKVALALGSGIEANDPRLRLLKVKFARFGIAFAADAPFTIRINAPGEPKAPEKPEGYALTVSRAGAAINGHDAQGLLWGIVSLIQLVDWAQEPRVRVCDILDWPDTARRGFLQGYWKDALEFMLLCKMNTVVSQSGVQITDATAHHPWTPLQRETCKRVCTAFTAFGLKHYFGIRQWTMYPKIPLSSERTFDLHLAVCSEVARHGGHIYFPFDDSRFPLPKADLEKFGAGANLDAKYVTRLFQAVREKHPGFHLVFCPPFYWGPDGRAFYPEPREPYLKSLGDSVDPGVEVIWTGPRVKGYQKSREQVAWFTGLTKHKPFLFQNGTGPHNLLSYITDETPQWRTWHYDGFFDHDIEGFLKNAHMGMEAPQMTTLADCLWNVRGYDAAASIRNGCAMLYGKEMFDLLDPANKALAYLDKYKYGAITPEAPTEIPEIERRLKIAENAFAKGKAYNAFSLVNFPGALERGIGFARTALARAKNPPDFFAKYKKDIEETRDLATKEAGADAAKGDILKLPTDFLGGTLLVYDNKCPRRFASLIRGSRTPNPRVTARFECDPFPPPGAYELDLCAQDDDAEAPVRIRIKVNGAVVLEGPSGFVRYGWSRREVVLPFAALRRNNTLTIECLEDSSAQSGPPWFMINYAVLRKRPPSARPARPPGRE